MRSILVITLTTTVLAATPANAQIAPAPAPDATFLMGSDMFAGGQSNNIGPALNQVLDNHWVTGACQQSDNYAKCDSIRFGMTVFAPGSCGPTINVQVAPQEDGGDYVEARAQSIHNEGGTTWCANAQFRPHDNGLLEHHNFTFPLGAGASESVLDQYWERPRLTLMFIGDLPQTSNSNTANRVIQTLRQACANFDGDGGILPSMPTWTFVTRKFDSAAVPYSGLVAAAGGTGACCYGAGCNPATAPIDVCAHIEDGRTDTQIRNDIQNGRYTCAGNGTAYGTGQLDFGTKTKGTLPEIRCHLVGTDNNDNCSSSNRTPTDILGIFSCVRQLPRGVTAADAHVLYCPTTDPADCVPIEDIGGSIEWIDEAQTLFLIEGLDNCDAIGISTCEEGIPCIVDNAVGRCAVGRTDCSTGVEVCIGLEGMPEICNGLDDDCDGRVDNISESWSKSEFSSVPERDDGIECKLRDVCMCPDGATDTHAGTTLDEYFDAWDPICACGEGLAMSVGEPARIDSATEEDPAAACTTTSLAREPGVVSALLAVLVGLFIARRR